MRRSLDSVGAAQVSAPALPAYQARRQRSLPLSKDGSHLAPFGKDKTEINIKEKYYAANCVQTGNQRKRGRHYRL